MYQKRNKMKRLCSEKLHCLNLNVLPLTKEEIQRYEQQLQIKRQETYINQILKIVVADKIPIPYWLFVRNYNTRSKLLHSGLGHLEYCGEYSPQKIFEASIKPINKEKITWMLSSCSHGIKKCQVTYEEKDNYGHSVYFRNGQLQGQADNLWRERISGCCHANIFVYLDLSLIIIQPVLQTVLIDSNFLPVELVKIICDYICWPPF